MTASEVDAVQSTALQPWSKLFVTIDEAALHDVDPAHHKHKLLKRWGEERGEAWPDTNQIAFIDTSESVNRTPEKLFDAYATEFLLQRKSEWMRAAVGVYQKLALQLSACCGAQMDPSYREHLHATRSAAAGGGGGGTDGSDGSRKTAHKCDLVDADAVEKALLGSSVFQKCNAIDVIARLSKYDGPFTGDYCSRAQAATIELKLVANDHRYRQL